MPPKCAICGKTAYPLESFNAVDKVYHKACFKCDVCKKTLNMTTYCGSGGKIYCKLHVPKASATSVADTVAMRQAMSAPKRAAEGLGTVLKGDSNTPTGENLSLSSRRSGPLQLADSAAPTSASTAAVAHTDSDENSEGEDGDGGIYSEEAYERLYEKLEG